MFDGIAGGSREACTVGWERLKAADLGGRSAASPRPTTRSTGLGEDLALTRS